LRGGSRYTHANLLAADLDYLVVETVTVRQEISHLPMDKVGARIQQFLAEVETLARSGGHHLRAMNA
jgi:hypothetical protein